MHFDVTGLYKRLSQLKQTDNHRDFGREVIATFWVQLQWNESQPDEEDFRAIDPKVFNADVDHLMHVVNTGGQVSLPRSPIENQDLYALAVLGRVCDRLLIEKDPFNSHAFIANMNGGSEDTVYVDHKIKLVGNHFSVLERGELWQRERTDIGRAFTLDAVIQLHAVFPTHLNGYEIDLQNEGDHLGLENALLCTEEGCVAIGYAGAYAIPRKWPQDEKGYVNFAPEGGLDDSLEMELRKHLRNARDIGAQIVLLPELMLTQSMAEDLKLELFEESEDVPPNAIIVPGTYHAEIEGKKRNRADLIFSNGVPIMSQDKQRPHVEPGFREQIKSAERLSVLLTPLGPLIIPICRDFCDDQSPTKDILKRLELKLLLVPSMGDENLEKQHKKRISGDASTREWRLLIAQQAMAPESENFLFGRCPACGRQADLCGGAPSPCSDRHFIVKKLF